LSWPIASYSRKLNPAQRNYTTMEKELLSIVETSQHYRYILLVGHCTFHCDHKNLGFQNFKSERVRRCRATLEEFQFSFVYCPGKDNCIADMLSQYPITFVDTSTYEEVTTLQDSSFPATFDCTYRTINAIFYTPNMEAHLRQYVNKCQVCRKSKPPTKKWTPT
jgi:hypothetical protein